MLTASQELTSQHDQQLKTESQLLLQATDHAFGVASQLLLQSWPERAAALTAAHQISTRRVVAGAARFMAATIGELTGFTPPEEDMVADPQAYVDRLAGMRDFARYAQTAPRRIGAQQALGKTLDEAIAIEHRGFAAIATGDPFRTWRKLTEDQTTAPTNPAWQGWVRVPESGACSFCRTLATRGAVYKKNTGNFRSHLRCRCQARAVLNAQAAAVIREQGAEAWTEMLRTGDVPKIKRKGSTPPPKPTTSKTQRLDDKLKTQREQQEREAKRIAHEEKMRKLREESEKLARERAKLREDLLRKQEETRRFMAARGMSSEPLRSPALIAKERAEARAAAPHPWANAKKKADHDTSRAGAVRDALATNPGHVKLVDGKVVKPRNYSVNCQRTAQAYEMRRRGYDVTAKPRPNKKVDRLNHTSDIESFWMQEDGKLGRFRHMGVGGGSAPHNIEARLAAIGPDARGFVIVEWQEGGGHIFNVERIDGVTHYVDPQTGGTSVAEIHFPRAGDVYFMRTDNLVPARDDFHRLVNGVPKP